jgi:adenine-specific DNA-methyltransferase
MDGQSLDILSEKLEKLKELYPESFTEDKIDWEKLKVSLGNDLNLSQERYHLNWAGKSEVFRILQQRTSATLVPVKEKSINFDKSENIFIEGENLEVLKVLQKSYFGKIKMIYIDPPYNTGSDSFIYPDRFSESKDEYLKRIGDKDEEGYLLKEGMFRKNSKDNGHYHSNWLSMMYPRLYLARNLLREDGVIFVSIDDNEVHNLRMIMNEIFGEENFIANIIWKSKTGSNDATTIDTITEYAIVYAKNTDEIEFKKNISGYNISRYRLKDEFYETRGPYYLDTLDRGGLRYSDKLNYGIECPDGSIVFPNGRKIFLNDGWTYKWSLDKVKWGIENKFIEIKEQRNGECDYKVYYKVYLNVDNEGNELERGSVYKNLITEIKTGNGAIELNNLFGFNVFKYSKPYELIIEFLSILKTEESIVLDFFAGSGSTAQAVMELNKEDGGNRKFILVQLPEKTDENSEAYIAGYKTIADICKERICRVIKKLSSEEDHKSQKDKNNPMLFTDHKLPKSGKNLSFSVFKLAPSNFKIWRSDVIENADDLEKMLNIFDDQVKPNAENENMVYELILKSGYQLDVEAAYMPSKDFGFYSINNNETIILLEAVNQTIVEEILKLNPKNVIALDKLFAGNDQLKTNTVLQMKDTNIEFRTV